MTDFEPAAEEVDIELDDIGNSTRRHDGRRQIGSSVGDPLHTTTPTPRTDRTARPRDGWLIDAGLAVVGAGVYFGVRFLVEGGQADAIANAERLQRFERSVGLDVEHSAQNWVLAHDLLRVIGNLSYVWLHWPLLIVVLVLLFGRDRDQFRRLRDALLWSGAIGLVIFATVPVAPPRFMPGFVGTVSDDARRHYIDYPLSWSNQFAALPSFHVGWTLIACLAIAGLIAHRAGRMLALVPAALVAISVVTTGNHYVVDALAGTVIAVAAFVATGRRARGPLPT